MTSGRHRQTYYCCGLYGDTKDTLRGTPPKNPHRARKKGAECEIERENTPDSLPVLTVSDKDKLVLPPYRQEAAHKLAAVIIDLEHYLGVGRVFIP
jgi:hypothetical protein